MSDSEAPTDDTAPNDTAPNDTASSVPSPNVTSPPGPVRRGRRIVVRDWHSSDIPAAEQWFRPGQRWRELDGPYYPQPDAAQFAEQMVSFRKRVESSERPEPRVNMAIADVDTDALIGRVSRYWQSEETHWLSLGIDVFDPERWGQGLGFEALGVWGQYLLDAMPNLARLDLRTWSGNPRMMRLAERLGYTLEARFRDARVVDGQLYDGVGYGVLRAEWNALYPEGFAAHLHCTVLP